MKVPESEGPTPKIKFMIDNLMVWNVRGLGMSKWRLRKLVCKFCISVLAISKQFQAADKLHQWAVSLQFPFAFSNADWGGKIWVCWKERIDMEVVGVSNQCITALFSDLNGSCLVFFVYAKCAQLDHRDLWDHICGLSCVGIPWVVVGDFNIIRSDEERVGVIRD